ncbi:unnamed protein product [Allacma fusca]|uniref:Uncharacterized protein n=1 Tax=Allacma fusca TaxID=39272 RepID=A0A8J2JRZ1_9HEXA|nr:unnamed protein product [Allacma fusca]
MRWGFFHPWKTLLTLSMAQDEELTWTSGRSKELSVDKISSGMDGQDVTAGDKTLLEEFQQEDNWISTNMNKEEDNMAHGGDGGESPSPHGSLNEETDQTDLDPTKPSISPRPHQQGPTLINLKEEETAILVSSIEGTIRLDIDKSGGGSGIPNEVSCKGHERVLASYRAESPGRDKSTEIHIDCRKLLKWTKLVPHHPTLFQTHSQTQSHPAIQIQSGIQTHRESQTHPGMPAHRGSQDQAEVQRHGQNMTPPEFPHEFSAGADNINGNLAGISRTNPGRHSNKVRGSKARKFSIQKDKVDPEEGARRASRVGFSEEGNNSEGGELLFSGLTFRKEWYEEDDGLSHQVPACGNNCGLGLNAEDDSEERTCVRSALPPVHSNSYSSSCSSDCESMAGKLLQDKWRELFDKFDPEGFGEIPWSDFLLALRSPQFLEAVEPGKILLLQDMAVSHADSLLSTAITYQHFVNIVSHPYFFLFFFISTYADADV